MNNNPQLVIIAVLAVLITGVADVILILSGKEMAEVVGGTWASSPATPKPATMNPTWLTM